jgi:hypothetical protein
MGITLIVILVHFLYFHDDVIMTYHDHNKNQSSMGIKKKCHVGKIVILANHGLLVMRVPHTSHIPWELP